MQNCVSKRTFSKLIATLLGLSSIVAFAESPELLEAIDHSFSGPSALEYSLYEAKAAGQKEDPLKKIEAEIDSVRKQLSASNSPNPGLYVLLADLYEKQAHAQYREEQAGFLAAYDKWYYSWQREEMPKLETEASKKSFALAASTYRKLFKVNNKYRRQAKYNFKMGLLSELTGSPNALLYYKQAIKSKPNSHWATKSKIGIAQVQISQKQFKLAEKNLLELTTADKGLNGQYSLYLLSWVYSLQGLTTKKPDLIANAEKILKTIASQRLPAVKDPNAAYAQKFLAEEAVKDLVWVWSNTNESPVHKQFFLVNKQNSAYETLLRRRGHLLLSRGDWASAARNFQTLFKASPSQSRNVMLHKSLIDYFHKQGNIKAVLLEVKQLNDKVTNPKNPWNKNNGSLAKAQRPNVRQLILDLANQYKQNYAKRRNIEILKTSAELYAIFLNSYPEAPNRETARYPLGDALVIIGQPSQAVDQFLLVAANEKQDMALRKSAGERMIKLQETMLGRALSQSGKPLGGISKPQPIPANIQKYFQLVNVYVKINPKTTKSQLLQNKVAEVHLNYGHYNRAITLLFEVVKMNPQTEAAEKSSRNILNLKVAQRNWQGVIDWSKKLLAFELEVKASLKTFLISKLRQGMWEYATELAKNKKWVPSAEAYIAFQKNFPKDPQSPLALHTAMTFYLQVAQGANALATGKILLAKYPSSNFVANTLKQIAILQEALGEFETSAETWVTFNQKFPRDNDAVMALRKAASIYEGIENADQAAALQLTIANNYPSSSYASSALLKYAELTEGVGDTRAAIGGYLVLEKKAQSREIKLLAQAGAARLMIQSGDRRGQTYLQRVSEQLKSKPRNFAVEVRNSLGDYYLNIVDQAIGEKFQAPDFQFDTISEYQRKQAKIMQDLEIIKKTGLSLGVSAGYQYDVKLNYRLGALYERIQTALYKSLDAPSDFTAKETAQLEQLREAARFKLQNSLEAFYEKAYLTANKQNIYVHERHKAYQRLSQHKPNQYKEVFELQLMPGMTRFAITY